MRVKNQTKLQTQLRFEHHYYIPSYFKLNRLATNLMCTRKGSLPSCPKTHLVKQGSFTNSRKPSLCYTIEEAMSHLKNSYTKIAHTRNTNVSFEYSST